MKPIFFRPLGNIPGETVARQAAAIENWPGSSARLGSIARATLVISGAEDILVPPTTRAIWVRSCPAPSSS